MIRFYKKDQEWTPGKEAELIYVDSNEASENYTNDVFSLLPISHPKSTAEASDNKEEAPKQEEKASDNKEEAPVKATQRKRKSTKGE